MVLLPVGFTGAGIVSAIILIDGTFRIDRRTGARCCVWSVRAGQEHLPRIPKFRCYLGFLVITFANHLKVSWRLVNHEFHISGWSFGTYFGHAYGLQLNVHDIAEGTP